MSEFLLTQKILELSVSVNWTQAKQEWMLDSIFHEEEPDTCLCGHFPINEICILKNIHNNETVIVGNVCVKKFIGLPSDKIFESVRKIGKEIEKSVNEETVNYAKQKNWINEWELDFYLDIKNKRILTDKQAAKKAQINNKILAGIVNARVSS